MAPTRSTPNIAARVALAYAVVASLWIVGSSLVVIGLPEPLGGSVEVAKGLLFVLVTALLLYLLLARWTGTLIDRLSRTDDALDQIRQISDCLPEGIVLLDADKNVGFLNPAAETLLCPGAPDVRGRRFVDVCEEAGGEGCAQVLPQLLGVGDLPGGLQIRGPDGAVRTLAMRAASLDSSKPEEGWVLALVDDTEAGASRRRSERLLAGYRFASLVSSETECAHDARQLLGRSCELAVASGGFVGAWAVVRDRSAGGFVDAGMVGLGPSARLVVEDMRTKAEAEAAHMLDRLSDGEIIYHNRATEDQQSGWGQVARENNIGSYTVFGVVESGRLLAAVGLFATDEGFFGVEERELIETLQADVSFALDRLALDSRRLDAEEALSQSENACRLLFEDNPLPMWIYEAETLEFLAVNDAAVAKYGYSRDEFLHLTIKDVRPETDIGPLVDHLAHKNQGFQDSGYWTHRDASGREFPVHIITHTTEWAGRPAQLVLVQEVAQVH